MRYLYADSTDFPYGFDFLAGLERLLLHGGRIATREAAIEGLETERRQDAASSEAQVAGLGRYVDEAHTALTTAELTTEDAGPIAENIGERLKKLLDQLAGEAEAAEAARLRRENAAAHDAIVEHRQAMRSELETLLLEAPLGSQEKRTTIRLRERAYGFDLVRTFPGGVAVEFGVDAARIDGWREPQTVETAAGAMEVQVGMKKKFLRQDLTREMVRIGDHVIVEAVLMPDAAEIRLERKPGSKKPPLLLELRRDGESVDVTIEREASDGTQFFPAVPSDAEKLEGLWEALEKTAEQAFAARARVLSVQVDCEDVLAEGHPLRAIDQMARELSPVIDQLAARTPNDHELCLKVEDDEGRREERYIRRRDLLAILEEAGAPAVTHLRHLTAI